MQHSETITKIAAALATAQAQIGNAHKDSNNPFFKSKYADLSSVMDACKGPLNAAGISVLQPASTDDTGTWVETILLHNSGEWLSDRLKVVVAKQNDPQALGSAITYSRRYGLQAMLAIPSDDDDGNAAAKPPEKRQTARREERTPDPVPRFSEAPQAQETATAGDTITGKVESVETKKGTSKKGTPYVLHIVKIGDIEARTFDQKLADMATRYLHTECEATVEAQTVGTQTGYKLVALVPTYASNHVKADEKIGMSF